MRKPTKTKTKATTLLLSTVIWELFIPYLQSVCASDRKIFSHLEKRFDDVIFHAVHKNHGHFLCNFKFPDFFANAADVSPVSRTLIFYCRYAGVESVFVSVEIKDSWHIAQHGAR